MPNLLVTMRRTDASTHTELVKLLEDQLVKSNPELNIAWDEIYQFLDEIFDCPCPEQSSRLMTLPDVILVCNQMQLFRNWKEALPSMDEETKVLFPGWPLVSGSIGPMVVQFWIRPIHDAPDMTHPWAVTMYCGQLENAE